MKILSIGNSFSQDAQRWLHDIALSTGVELQAVNLYIGGCPLSLHWENMQSDAQVYDYEQNGVFQKHVSLRDALQEQSWDVITFQQASHFSGDPATYQPYLEELAKAVRQLCPDAELYIHQTWSYEIDSDHGGFAAYQNDQRLMYDRLTACYWQAAAAIDAAILPVGDVIQHLREHTDAFDYAHGGLSLCRDGFHLSLDYGRYAAALTWYGVLTGRDVREVTFVPCVDGQLADKALLGTVQQSVHAILAD